MDYSNINVEKELEIVFMGTPEFAVPVLQGLIDNYKIRAVVTQPDRPGNHGQINVSPIKKLASEHAILVLQPEHIKEEYQEILKDVHKHPKKYLAQKRFISKPLTTPQGTKYHVCLGSYTIDGKHTGFYARISPKPRIDSDAEDIPVVIERSKSHE